MNFLPFFIAKRFYIQNKKNCLMLLLSILSQLGVAVSIFILIVSISAINGFKILINKNILSSLPHGVIKSINQPFLSWKKIIKKINCISGIYYSEPYILMNGMLLKEKKIRFLNIKSVINIRYIKKYFFLNNKMYHFMPLNNLKNNQIILSSDLSNDLSVKQGDWINLIIVDENFSVLKNQIKIFSLQVHSIFNSNGIVNSNIGLVNFSFFQNNFNIHKNINAIELYMSDPLQANNIIVNVTKNINTPVFFYTWMNQYNHIYNDIKKIKITTYIILFLLIIISCFNIIAISLLSISKKIKDISILRSMGANNQTIRIIFLYYTLRFIFFGALIGLISGIITVLNSKKIIFFLEKYFSNTFLLNNVYSHHFLLLQLSITDIIIIFFSTIIIGIITSWYPVYYATKIDPSKVLKQF